MNGYWDIIDTMTWYEGPDYHWNDYDVINGKKETLLDIVDCLLSNQEFSKSYNTSKLKLIRVDIEELGGKNGSEL